MKDDISIKPSVPSWVEGTAEAGAGDEIRVFMQEITAMIDGGKVPAAVDDFWRQVGLRYQMAAPHGSNASEIARLVLERLDVEWDDEFVEEDGITPSLQAYEALFNKVKEQIEGEEAEEPEGDDDTAGSLAKAIESGQIMVQGMDPPIQAIINQIEDGTIVLNPDWQRGYVWKPAQRKKFIDSIFMSLPIPPVLLYEDKDTKRLFVIDGRQRLETVWRFHRGSIDRERRFRTPDKKTPGWGEGERLSACAGKYYDKLPEEWKRHFKNFVIPARKFSLLPRRTLYEVFKRYNTGAVKLQAAEIRNAIYQGVPLHDMLFRISGEVGENRLTDPQEIRVVRLLNHIMKKKKARYGAYNFVGRCLAFRHVREDVTVAAAIIRFMEDNRSADIELFRSQFLNAFEKALDWYENPLAVATQDTGKVTYHEWVATIQVVSTMVMLDYIGDKLTDEESVKSTISKAWSTFVYGNEDNNPRIFIGGLLQDKQNTRTHWGRQREWIHYLETECKIPESATQDKMAL